jgi:maleylpyruvate isomerase
LGDTISLDDRDWRATTALPGWSRAHIATHLAHHGQAVTTMALDIRHTRDAVVWHTQQSQASLNAGARRGAVALQEALDQSSATLMSAFDLLDVMGWSTSIRTSQGLLPAPVLVVDRLNQVVIHHIDLGLDLDFADLEPNLTRTLLQWNLFRAIPRFARVELTVISDEGFTGVIGHGPAATVRGNETNILGWLLGRKDASAVLGAEGLDLADPV